MTLKHAGAAKPVPGTEIEAVAEGLPPGRTVDLMWQTVNGGWVIEDYFHFRGKKFTETARSLGQAVIGGDGRLSARFAIPEDYGGVHELVVSDHGTPIAQGGVEVSQTFEMRPTEGPVGTPIEIHVKGLGWRTMESTWVINWDNQEVGWVSATGSRGTATARFRASGGVGDHQVRVYTGYMGQGYLNHEQAPNAYLPRPAFVFRITPGNVATAAYAEPYQKQPVPERQVKDSGPTASVTPTQGPVLTRARLESGRAARQHAGDARVGHVGRQPRLRQRLRPERDRALEAHGAARTAGSRRRSRSRTISAASTRSPSARASRTLATTHFVTETSIVGISPASGPAGTPVTIHLKGVGWTDYDNIYAATYDNGYMGYACGFNSRGDVVINFTAAGSPGIHLIDLYPGIYQGPEGSQQLYRLPQLTYADDHPGNRIPALRFAFEVTRSTAGGSPARGTR